MRHKLAVIKTIEIFLIIINLNNKNKNDILLIYWQTKKKQYKALNSLIMNEL